MIGLAFCGCNAPTGKSHYVLAERFFADHKYEAAVQEFHIIVQNDPKSALAQQALFRIATVQYLYLNAYFDALRSFKQFAVNSQNQDFVYQAEKSIGDIYFSKLEEYKLSIEQYRRLIEKFPKSTELDFFYFRLAKSYYGGLDFTRAIEAYQELLKRFPRTQYISDVYYQIGNTYFTKGQLDSAIDSFAFVTKTYPDSQQAVFARFGIANCLEEKEKFQEALYEYQAILAKHPSKNVVEAKIKRLQQKIRQNNK